MLQTFHKLITFLFIPRFFLLCLFATYAVDSLQISVTPQAIWSSSSDSRYLLRPFTSISRLTIAGYTRAEAKNPFMNASKMNASAFFTNKLCANEKDKQCTSVDLVVYKMLTN